MEEQQGGKPKFPKWAWIALGIVVVIGVIMFFRNATAPVTKAAASLQPTGDPNALAAQLSSDEKALQDFESSTTTQLTAIGGSVTTNANDIQTIQGSLAQAQQDAANAVATANAASATALYNGRLSQAISSIQANGSGPASWTSYINSLTSTDPNADLLGMASSNLGLRTKFNS